MFISQLLLQSWSSYQTVVYAIWGKKPLFQEAGKELKGFPEFV